MPSGTLESLFSETSKNTFARALKVTEFSSTNKLAPREDSSRTTHQKKKKCKHSRLESRSITYESNINGEGISCCEKESRTCFVGNVSLSESKQSILKLFGKFGDIESVRVRSIPVEGTPVDDNGNQNLVKKICSNKKKYGDQKLSCNAYVVFKEKESVKRAISINNKVFGGRHIRVDHCKPSTLNTKRTVFVGSLPYYVDEEDLRNHFATVSFRCVIVLLITSS